MEEQPDEDAQPDRAEHGQLVCHHRQVGRGKADGGEAQVREDVAERADELERPHDEAERAATRDQEHEAHRHAASPRANAATIPPGTRSRGDTGKREDARRARAATRSG